MGLVGAAAASLVGPAIGIHVDATLALLIIALVWMILGWCSIQGSRLAAASPSLIAAGRFDAAEEKITGSLKSFSLSRKVKLLGLHHLAVLRHAQRRWQDAAMLCNALLGQRKGRGGDANQLMRSARLMLAESLLELNDLPGTYAAISRMHDQAGQVPNLKTSFNMRMSLPEAMHLMLVQLDYESRIGAWAAMLAGLTRKVELAELMPAEGAARTQSLLALAAKHVGRSDWSDWLKRRSELLLDPARIVADRPLLTELWP